MRKQDIGKSEVNLEEPKQKSDHGDFDVGYLASLYTLFGEEVGKVEGDRIGNHLVEMAQRGESPEAIGRYLLGSMFEVFLKYGPVKDKKRKIDGRLSLRLSREATEKIDFLVKNGVVSSVSEFVRNAVEFMLTITNKEEADTFFRVQKAVIKAYKNPEYWMLYDSFMKFINRDDVVGFFQALIKLKKPFEEIISALTGKSLESFLAESYGIGQRYSTKVAEKDVDTDTTVGRSAVDRSGAQVNREA